MTFNIGDFVNKSSEKFTGGNITKSIAKNPFILALLITIIIIVIMIFVLRDVNFDDSESSLSRYAIRIFIYSFITVFGIQCIAHKTNSDDMKESKTGSVIDDVFTAARGGNDIKTDSINIIVQNNDTPPGMNIPFKELPKIGYQEVIEKNIEKGEEKVFVEENSDREEPRNEPEPDEDEKRDVDNETEEN